MTAVHSVGVRTALLRFMVAVLAFGAWCTGNAWAQNTPPEPAPAVKPLATVPFVLTDNDIRFTARLSGRELECSLSTGIESTRWASWLVLEGRYATDSQTRSDGNGGTISEAGVVLDSVQIGDFTVRDVPSYRVFADSFPVGVSPTLRSVPVLGTNVFAGHTLVIDYRKKRLEVYDASVPLEKLAVRPRFALLDFAPPATGKSLGQPVIPCTIAGQNSPILLDTGWTGSGLGATPTLARRFPNQEPAPSALSAPTDSPNPKNNRIASNVIGAIVGTPEFTFMGSVYLVNPLPNGIEGIMGSDLLQHFRVTLNFKTGKLMLESQPNVSASKVPPPPPGVAKSGYPPPPGVAKPGYVWQWNAKIEEWVEIPFPPQNQKP